MTEHMIAGCDCRVDGHHIGNQLSLLGSLGTFIAVYGFWSPNRVMGTFPAGYGFWSPQERFLLVMDSGLPNRVVRQPRPPRGEVPWNCGKVGNVEQLGMERLQRDMTLVIAWRAFTALQHSCILYCCVLGGMCVHLNFPGWHVCLTYIAYHVYSVIDPSGIMILGADFAAVQLCSVDLCRGCGLWAYSFEIRSFAAFQCIFLPLTRPMLVLLLVV